MSIEDRLESEKAEGDELDQIVEEALINFRLSVHAWSEAVQGRTRELGASAPQRRVWRMAAAWGLGCVLVAGGVSTAIYERHEKQVKIAAVLEAQRRRQLGQEKAREEENLLARVDKMDTEEDLLAKVDSDVSRQVPSAMEPLAQLMVDNDSR